MRALFLAVMLATTMPAFADDVYRACLDSTGTNVGWLECGVKLVERSEAKMQSELQAVLGAATTDQAAAVRVEQDLWQKYRSESCRYFQHDLGREGQVLDYFSCVAGRVNQRAKELSQYQ